MSNFKIVPSNLKKIDEKGEFFKKVKKFFSDDYYIPTFKLKAGDKIVDDAGKGYVVVKTESPEDRAEKTFLTLKLRGIDDGKEWNVLTGTDKPWIPLEQCNKKLRISSKKLTEAFNPQFNLYKVKIGYGDDVIDACIIEDNEETVKDAIIKKCPHCKFISAEKVSPDMNGFLEISAPFVDADFEERLGWNKELINEGLSTYTVMFFHEGNTYTGVISATSEEDAKKKFAECCPHCSIDRVQKGRLAFDAFYIGPGFEEDMGWDEKETSRYEVIDSKSVRDSDGFYTDYTLYYDNEEDIYLCIFGDEDLYTPSNSEPDVEFDTEREAIEWFENYNGYEDDIDEDWEVNKSKKVLVYKEEDIPDVAEYLMNWFPDETAGWEGPELKTALYALHGNIKGIEGLPFSFDMEEEEEGDELDEDVETEDTIKINQATKNKLNKICQKYCGWKLPEEIRTLWDELVEAGVDPILVQGYPTSVAEDGGKSWEINYTIKDKDVINSRFIYQVYEGNGDSLKNEYNIYFS